MDFLEKLNFLMERDKYNKNSLSKASGIPYTTIDGWYKRGYDELRLPTVKRLCSFFNTSLDFWLKEDVTDPDYGKANGFEISFNEMEQIKKYRFISLHSPEGIKTVDYILDREYSVAEQIQKHNETLSDLQRQYSNQPAPLIELEQTAHPRYTIPYYQRLASARSGEYLFDSIPTDTIEVPANQLSEQADFVIGVNGHSMEPTFCDGDKVYVRLADEIPMGRIGIFTRGSECFIKELGADRLISHNAHKALYPDIPAREEGIKLVGEVLGKVEED